MTPSDHNKRRLLFVLLSIQSPVIAFRGGCDVMWRTSGGEVAHLIHHAPSHPTALTLLGTLTPLDAPFTGLGSFTTPRHRRLANVLRTIRDLASSQPISKSSNGTALQRTLPHSLGAAESAVNNRS